MNEPAVIWPDILSRYDRIALAGGPQVGKTTLASTVKDRPVFQSDDFKMHPWEDVPFRMIEAVADTPRFLIEGVMVARALRKGLDVDCVVVLHAPVAKRLKGQIAMAKGIHTVLNGITLAVPRFDFRQPVYADVEVT